MPLGSAPKSTIDIDFTRAQGINSSGRITFQPPRVRVETTMLSTRPVPVEIDFGVGSVELVQLPAGTYHVREEIDGRPPYEFDFSLPVGAASPIRYETIAQVSPVPTIYTYVRTVNGVAPNPSTGNVVVTAEAGPHTHPHTDITDWNSAVSTIVSAAIAALIDSAPGALDTLNELAAALGDDPNFASTVNTALAARIPATVFDAAGDLIVGTGSDTYSRFAKGSDNQVLTVVGGALVWATPSGGGTPAHRIARFTDVSRTSPTYYPIQDTGNAWQLLTGGPEYTIAAAIGEDIEADWDCLIESASNWWQDLVVVSGGTPTIQRYLVTKTSTPAFEGVPGNAPVGSSFQGRQFKGGFLAEASDIDGGLIRLRWAVKSANGTGRMYANPNYPLNVNLRNSRTPAA